VQNIELTANSTCNWTIWIFYSFTADECSVR